MVSLAEEAAAEPQALVNLLATWVRGLEIGLFGPGRIRLQGGIENQGRTVSAVIECEEVSRAAVHALSRIIHRFSNVTSKVDKFAVFYEGQQVGTAGRIAIPALPQSIPFTVEYPADLKHYVRVEIEFRNPISANERDAIFDAFSIWDVVIEALGEEKREGRWVDYKSRLLSPAIVEHDVHGFYASYECLYFIVWLALRLHRRLTIDRLTME